MIRIETEPWAQMVAHARETYPNECCGAMLGSTDGEQKLVRIALPLKNAFEGAQAARYELHPEDLLAAAYADLKTAQAEMAKLAAPKTVEQALDDIARPHTTPAT